MLFLSKGNFAADPFARPRRSDALPAALGFAGLVLISSALGFAESFFAGDGFAAYAEPLAALDWPFALASCAATGYLEEAYFRAYLPARLKTAGASERTALLVSIILFALCHLYEGAWGTLNAAAAGAGLAFLFGKTRSVHAAAWAHAAYNLFAYSGY